MTYIIGQAVEPQTQRLSFARTGNGIQWRGVEGHASTVVPTLQGHASYSLRNVATALTRVEKTGAGIKPGRH